MAELLTPSQAAAWLKISVKTLRGHVQDGSITMVITGRGKKRPRYGFAQSDLDEFEKDRRRRRAPEEIPCRSTGRKKADTTTTTSGEVVFGFSALRAKRLSEQRRP